MGDRINIGSECSTNESMVTRGLTPREISNRMLFKICRLAVPFGHPCGQQWPLFTVKAIKFLGGKFYIIDSFKVGDGMWVIEMDLDCAQQVCAQEPAFDKGLNSFLSKIPLELCKCMRIITAEEFLHATRDQH